MTCDMCKRDFHVARVSVTAEATELLNAHGGLVGRARAVSRDEAVIICVACGDAADAVKAEEVKRG